MPRNKSYSKDEVLEKAMLVFWENGYEATSVRQLEKAMGINQFSIYASFSNKKGLFIESLKNYRKYVKTNRFQNLLKDHARLSDLEVFFWDFTKAIKQGNMFNGCLVVNTAGEMGAKDENITRELNNYFTFIKEMMKNVLKNSLEAGDISQAIDIEQHSNFLLGIMQGLSIGTKVLSEKQIKDIINIALNTIK